MAADVKRFAAHLIWSKAIFSSWVLLALASPEVGGRKLSKFFLTNYSEAVCNDGSPASFYYSPSPSGLDQWIVYLEGGSFCENNQTCASRPEYHTTTNSLAYPETLVGTDLFESGSSSPFGDFHAVYVPYCTSDMHAGLRKAPLVLPNKKNFYIRGGFVIEGVFKELEKRGLNDNSKIVLAGTSAGALGALIHGIRFRQVGKYQDLALLIDSGWFLNHNDVLGKIYSTFEYADSIPQGICNQTAHAGTRLSCCLSPNCLVERFVSELGIPTFLVASLADMFVFSLIMRDTGDHPDFDFTNAKNSFPLQVNLYAGEMNLSLAESSRYDVISIFQSGCAQHVYFRNNPLLSTAIGGSSQLSVATADGVSLQHTQRIRPGYWQDVTVNNVSLSSALSSWVMSNYSQQITWESCMGFLCNPTCPDKIHTRLVQIEIPKVLELFVLVMATASIILPILLKIYLSVSGYLVLRAMNKLRNRGMPTRMSKMSEKLSKNQPVPFETRREPFSRALTRENSLMSASGEDLHLSCRNLSVTVNTKRNVTQSNPDVLVEKATVNTIPVHTKVILKDVNLKLHTNELVGVLGPSGSGKTTLLHVLANRHQGYQVKVRQKSSSLKFVNACCVFC